MDGGYIVVVYGISRRRAKARPTNRRANITKVSPYIWGELTEGVGVTSGLTKASGVPVTTPPEAARIACSVADGVDVIVGVSVGNGVLVVVGVGVTVGVFVGNGVGVGKGARPVIVISPKVAST